MRNKNSVSLIGIVGKDAEVRSTQQGIAYARFTLATSTGGYKKADGTDVPEQTQWHDITCWRNLADFSGKYVKKGMKVDVEGMIVYGNYTDAQGVNRKSVEILASDIVLMSQPQGIAQQHKQAPQQVPQQQQQAPQQPQVQIQVQQPQPQQQQQQQARGYQQNGGVPFPPPASGECPF